MRFQAFRVHIVCVCAHADRMRSRMRMSAYTGSSMRLEAFCVHVVFLFFLEAGGWEQHRVGCPVSSLFGGRVEVLGNVDVY